MTNNSDDNIFLNFLSGVKPIKKTNKITKSLPKQKLVSKSKFKPKTKELNKPPEKKKHITTLEKLRIEKSSINRKLKKGKIKINKKIDFHGCSIEEAKELFLSTINECFLKNYRCILFVTGKGINKKLSDNPLEKKLYFGKIRNNFLRWTSIPTAQNKILNVQQANIENGGDGAFFVYLRKNKN